eukprot:gene32168-11032_t
MCDSCIDTTTTATTTPTSTTTTSPTTTQTTSASSSQTTSLSTSQSTTPTTTSTTSGTSSATTTETSSPTTTGTSSATTSPTSSQTTTPTTTTTQTTSPSTTPTTTTPTTTPTTDRCYPIADIVFVIDTSTSIEDPESGGSPGGVNKLARFAANMVRELGDNIEHEGIRIAAVTFATKATVEFEFTGRIVDRFSPTAPQTERTPDNIAAALESIRYREHPGVQTDSNIHAGLLSVRQELITAGLFGSGYRGQTLHVIVLTDGNARNSAGDAASLLQAELQLWQHVPLASRWAF